MSEHRRHRLSQARAVTYDGPVLTRRQKEKVARLRGIATALDFDVTVSLPREHDAPAHLRLRSNEGDTVHVVVFCGGEASRFAAPSDQRIGEQPLPPALSKELTRA